MISKTEWNALHAMITVALVIGLMVTTSRSTVNTEDCRDSLEFISDLTDIVTELDQRMDSMEDRPEISISYGTVITTEDEIIIQEEEI